VLPGVPATPAPFVIVGMMALFGGIAHAPLAVMLMVAEMTGNLSLLAPAMIAVSIAYVLVGQTSIYSSQVPTRADSPAHRLQFSFPLLSTLVVRQAMRPIPVQLSAEHSIEQAISQLDRVGQSATLVVDESGSVQGVFDLEDAKRVPQEQRAAHTVGEVMQHDVPTIRADETLDTALEELTTDHVYRAAVVEGETLVPGRLPVGMLSMNNIVELYRATTKKEARRI
jgi:CIC family chloride channel protein